jgi:hypothetical protein
MVQRQQIRAFAPATGRVRILDLLHLRGWIAISEILLICGHFRRV